MEKEYQVKPVGVKYICDTCEKGEMLPNGKNNWNVELPLFEHECSHCNTRKMLTEKFPLIRYINIGF